MFQTKMPDVNNRLC